LSLPSAYTTALAKQLTKHVEPVSGYSSVLVGSNVQPIADYLSSGFSAHCFKTEADPVKVLNGLAGDDQPCNLICFIDAFTEMTGLLREQVLSEARNSLVCRVLHLELESSGDNQWQLTDSLALGYRRIDTGKFEQIGWSLYEFNIANYKQTPDWLNADHWSNPRQWDQYRW